MIGEDNAGYDRARRIWNGKINRKPRLIAQCLDQGDVLAPRHREVALRLVGVRQFPDGVVQLHYEVQRKSRNR